MSDAVVSIRGLRKVYGSVVAVDDMNMEVPRGSLFGLLGPNGAGKSTTFGICCGWLRPTAGEASLLGVPSDRLHELRGRLSALPQDAWFPRHIPVHVQLTHFGRLAGLSGAEAQRETERVIDQVGLSEAAGRKGIELSHGMLKRIGLAQALIGKPEVVFLDEPTSGLDPASGRKIKDVIAGLVPEATVVISSHNLAEIQEICTDGAILDHGKLVVKGTIDDLTRRGAEIAVEVRAGADIPEAKLRGAFGAEQIDVQPGIVRITFSSQRDVAEVIAEAMRILLDAGVPVLGVRRGTSLETAFLEITGKE
jgi:ABC-type multidrug transport system ATPase subunit